MAKLQNHIEAMIVELTRLQEGGGLGYPTEEMPLPGLIYAGEEGSILVSHNIESSIQQVALEIARNDKDLLEQLGRKKLNEVVRSAFGLALTKIDLDHGVSENAMQVLGSACRFVSSNLELLSMPTEYGIALTFFSEDFNNYTEIVPVIIERKDRWLERLFKKGNLCRYSPPH